MEMHRHDDLKIRVNGKDGKKYLAHTLNNTVVAPPRMLIAFLENNLNADGSVSIPKATAAIHGWNDQDREKDPCLMGDELFQGGVLMHSYLRAVGFSRSPKEAVLSRLSWMWWKPMMRNMWWKIIRMVYLLSFPRIMDVIAGLQSADSMMKTISSMWITISRFSGGTGITTQENVVIERHADKESFAGACDDLRIGVTLIFYLQNAAEYLQQRGREEMLSGNPPLTLSGLAREGKILFPCRKR